MNQLDFQKEFDEALEAWRQRHHIRDEDVILLCLELFRIHQEHWDAIGRRDFSSVSGVSRHGAQTGGGRVAANC